MNALVVIDNRSLTAETFHDSDALELLLTEMEKHYRSIVTDVTTEAGRKDIKSLNRKIAGDKNRIDEAGKALVSGMKAQAKLIDTARGVAWDRLEALQAEVMADHNAWEDAEKLRIAEHQDALQIIIDLGTFGTDLPASIDVIARLQELEALPARVWQEFNSKARTARANTFAALTAFKEAALAREEEATEAERLRRETAEREREEREARIAEEAAEKAKLIAEAKAAREAKEAEDRAAAAKRKADAEIAEANARAEKAQRDAAEAARRAEDGRLAAVAKVEADRLQAIADAEEARRQADARIAAEAARAARAERDAIDAAAKAEADKIAAAAKAEADRLAAVEAERQRIADAAALVLAETARREKDKAHKTAINSAALEDLIRETGLSIEAGTKVIVAIARNKISHVKISY